jgi:hypothetical protein
MIRPWYRSRLFWLGMPCLLFLFWGWFAKSRVWGEVKVGGHRLAIGNTEGQLRILFTGSSHGFVIAGRQGTDHQARETSLLPSAIKLTVIDFSSGWRLTNLKLAYWFLLLLYVTAWSIWLVAWQRRKARLLKAPAEPPR